MLVTVIIPVKNEEANLARLLPILRDQTIKPEIIVAMAPKTTDRSKLVAQRHGARVIAGGLPGVGRNAGARAAKGEFVFFMDADVLPGTRDFLEGAVLAMKQR